MQCLYIAQTHTWPRCAFNGKRGMEFAFLCKPTNGIPHVAGCSGYKKTHSTNIYIWCSYTLMMIAYPPMQTTTLTLICNTTANNNKRILFSVARFKSLGVIKQYNNMSSGLLVGGALALETLLVQIDREKNETRKRRNATCSCKTLLVHTRRYLLEVFWSSKRYLFKLTALEVFWSSKRYLFKLSLPKTQLAWRSVAFWN